MRGGWVGTLVSDDFAVYRSWEPGRQSCLAHLLRAALGLAQSVDARIAACGRWGLKELLRLVRVSPVETRVGDNSAERSLRHGVVLRKISLGTSSDAGRRWIKRALSLYQTCRLQKRSFFEALGEALGAAWGDVAPDLGWIEAITAQYAPATQAPTP